MDIAAQIGRPEICVPVATAQAVSDIQHFLSSGFAECDEPCSIC
jgi:hypothetical protein